MAELQWAVQVRCVNALLAEIKVGEKGELVIVDVPDRNFGPSELDKLIQGLEVACDIAAKNRRIHERAATKRHSCKSRSGLGRNVKIQDKRSLYQMKLLKTGEIIRIDVPDMLFTPSEIDRFVAELRSVRDQMKSLRAKI